MNPCNTCAFMLVFSLFSLLTPLRAQQEMTFIEEISFSDGGRSCLMLQSHMPSSECSISCPETLRELEHAATGTAPECQFKHALFLLEGPPETRQQERGLSLLMALAEKGYNLAQLNAGWLHYRGLFTEKNPRLAMEWFQRAATPPLVSAENLPVVREAEYLLGIMSLQKKETTSGLSWLSKAAAHNDVRAKIQLAYLHLQTLPHQEQSKHWFHFLEEAATKGHIPLAQVYLGQLYYLGRHVPRDLSKARELFGTAALQQDPVAKFFLSTMYLKGEGGDQDDHHAQIYLQEAAEDGLPLAQTNLAFLHLQKGNMYYPEKAERLLERAAEKDDILARYNLGLLYSTGTHRPQNLEKAYKFLSQAAAQEYAPAQYALGWIKYSYGRNVEEQAEGIAFIKKAAKQGDTSARDFLSTYINQKKRN